MKSNKAFGGSRVMSELAVEMKNAVIALAGQRHWGETRQRWLERAARRAGITYRSARALFYCEGHEPRASVLHSVRAAVNELEKTEAKTSDPELEEMRLKMATLQSRFDRLDSEFFVFQSQAFGAASSPAGRQENESSGEGRAVDRGEGE